MMKKEKKSPEDSSLRQKAEAIIKKLDSQKANLPNGRIEPVLSEAEVQKLIHELQVYQIELEMQNAEMQNAIEKAAIAIALYDFAPTGYFTVKPNSAISQLNLSGARMLGKERLYLRNCRLNQFITPDTQPVFNEFLQKCFETSLKQTCEIGLAINGRHSIFLYLEGMVTEDNHECLVVAVDITERKRTEELLRESEKMYRLLAGNLPETSVFLFDHNLRFILAEGILHPEFGFTTIDMEGKTLWELLPQERANRLTPIYKNAIEGKPTENLISEYKGHSYSVNILPVKNKQGEIIAGMVVSQDITKRKQAEEALKSNYSLLRIAGETAKFGGWSLNLANNKVTWSDEVAAIHEMPAGYSPLLGEGINFYAPEWKDKISQAVTDCIEKGIPFDEEMELITAKGNRIWVRVIGSAIQNNNGKTVKIQGAFQNINDRKQADEAKKISEARLKRAEIASKSGNWELHLDSQTIVGSEGAMKLYGIDKTEFSYDAIRKIPLPEYRPLLDDAMKKLIEADQPYNLEFKIKTADTNEIKDIHSIAIFDKEKRIVFGVIQDITDQKRTEEALKESEARLRELNATKDKFFSIIAHDLKSPFNSIIGFSSLLERQIQERDYAAIERYAGIIQNSSQQALDLLINLLEWTRSQTGRMVFNPESIDIVALINQSTELLNPSALQKSITIYSETPVNLNVFADKAMIGTILRNLISNAIKFTNTGGEVIISTKHILNEIVISVTDSGVGINSDSIGKLFRMDESYSTLGTQNEKGTGLGLLLCKEFVDKHRGRIWVESEPEKGSTFFFSIPCGVATN